MDFPKKQAQRLMPLYLLEYSEKLFTNHPDPSAPWGGGGGSDYTAGQGITITNNEISVDTNVIATKSDISSMVTTTQLNDALDDYALKPEIPTDVSQLYNDAGYATETWVQNQGYITNSAIPTVNNPTITFTQGGTTKGTITLNQSGDQTIEFDAGSSLPDSPFLNVEDPQDQMFFSLDGSDSSWYKHVDLSATPNRMFHVNLSALNPVFKEGLKSTYNEQTNQLEVSLSATNLVTTDGTQTITGSKTFDSAVVVGDSTRSCSVISMDECGLTRIRNGIRDDFKTRISGSDGAFFEYRKSSNPDGSNPTVSNIYKLPHQDVVGSNTYTLATTDDLPSIPDTSKFVTTDTAQEITGIKTFAHNPANITDAGIKIDMYDPVKTKAGVEFNTHGTGELQNWCLAGFNGDLRIRQLSGTGDFAISNIGIIPKNINSANLGDSSNKWNNLYLAGNLSDGTNSVTVADIATKNDIPDFEYHKGDTYVNSHYINSTGYITNSQKEITFTIIVPKLLTNITNVTVNRLEGLLRGVKGYVNGVSDIDYATTSEYTISTYIGAPNAVTISIIKSSEHSNSTNNTPINMAFAINGLQLTFN